jgi:Cu-Zn family superoxide dismutase
MCLRLFVLLCSAVFLMCVTSCGPASPASAGAEIKDASGQTIGQARFEPAGDDVNVSVNVRGLAPGAHGIHVHEVGKCDPPEFASSGAHFNPGGQPHHGGDAEHRHAGDMPNLVVGPDGTGRMQAVLRGITMKGRGHHSLFHLNGTSILIHRDADDLKTAPSGNSGDRIACGVVTPIGD